MYAMRLPALITRVHRLDPAPSPTSMNPPSLASIRGTPGVRVTQKSCTSTSVARCRVLAGLPICERCGGGEANVVPQRGVRCGADLGEARRGLVRGELRPWRCCLGLGSQDGRWCAGKDAGESIVTAILQETLEHRATEQASHIDIQRPNLRTYLRR